MNDKITELLFQLALAVIPILASMLALELRRYLQQANAKAEAVAGKDNYVLLMTVARRAVKAAEQVFDVQSNDKKLNFAMSLLSVAAERYGVELPKRELLALIEAAVSELPEN